VTSRADTQRNSCRSWFQRDSGRDALSRRPSGRCQRSQRFRDHRQTVDSNQRNFNARQLSDLPTSRSISAILSATPAVHVGRFEVGAPPLACRWSSSSGQEGTTTTVRRTVITRTGHFSHSTSTAIRFDAARRDGSARSQSGVELSRPHADVGGYIARDKAWWYLSSREQNVAARVVNFPVRPLRTELANYTGKVTYEFKRKNRGGRASVGQLACRSTVQRVSRSDEVAADTVSRGSMLTNVKSGVVAARSDLPGTRHLQRKFSIIMMSPLL
jgi:hypothetical protein